MANKTVYRKVIDPEVGADVLLVKDNKTMILEQMTFKPPGKAEKAECRTLDDVFATYNPEADVQFENEGGTPEKETLRFSSLNDFGPKGLAKNSKFLKELGGKVEIYEKLIGILKKNKALREALSNPETKQEVIKGLKAMLVELDESNK